MNNTGVPGYVKKRVLPILIARDGFVCHYCGVGLVTTQFNEFNRHGASLDHINPQSKGGKHTLDNLVLCCRQCNIEKRAQSYEEFRYTKEINAVQLWMLEGEE